MIAISYRREDSLAVAGRLYDRLEQRFGKQNVFMDFDSIRPGFDFRDQIRDTIERSKVVIAVIGPDWLGKKSDGTRRIDDPADFVRLEVACALQQRIPVIPVLVNNTPMPNAETLPSEIQALAFRHALPLDSGLDFRQHADRLINGISDTVGVPSSPPPAVTGTGKPKSWIVSVGIGLAVAVTMAATMIWLKSKSLKSEPSNDNSGRSQQTSATLNQSLPTAPAARFAGAWVGQMKIGTENHDITLTVNADATSLLQESKRAGQPPQQHPHPTTINGETLVWIGGDSGNVSWRLRPNADGQTASATTSIAGIENTATFTRLREDSAGNTGARLSVSQTATVSALPTTQSNAPPPLDIAGQGLKGVTVKKYNCAVLVPNALFPDAQERFDNASTDRIQSVNGCSTVALRSEHETVKRVYENYVAHLSGEAATIDYKVQKDGWFVVSGDLKTTGYYTKGVRRGSDVLLLELQYDGDACNIPDGMLTEMSRKFDGSVVEPNSPTAAAISSPTAIPQSQKLFAGTWQGTLRRTYKNYNVVQQDRRQLQLSEDETTGTWSIPGIGQSGMGVPFKGWVHSGPRSLSFRSGYARGEMTVHEDRTTATYVGNEDGDGVSLSGTLHKVK